MNSTYANISVKNNNGEDDEIDDVHIMHKSVTQPHYTASTTASKQTFLPTTLAYNFHHLDLQYAYFNSQLKCCVSLNSEHVQQNRLAQTKNVNDIALQTFQAQPIIQSYTDQSDDPEELHSLNSQEYEKFKKFLLTVTTKVHQEDDNEEEELILTYNFDTMSRIVERIKNRIHPDIIVKIGNSEIKCHSFALSLYSPELKKYRSESTISLNEKNIDMNTFQFIYNWMLEDDLPIEEENLAKIYCAAKYLAIKELEKQCLVYYESESYITEFSAFVYVLMTMSLEALAPIHNIILRRIYKSFLTMVSCKEYPLLEEKHIKILFTSNRVGVNSETELFYAALIWLAYNWPKRKNSVESILEYLRFGFISPQILNLLLTRNYTAFDATHYPVLDELFQSKKVAQSIKDGLVYSSILVTFSNNRNEFIARLEYCKLSVMCDRYGIIDRDCKYHKQLNNSTPNLHYITFQEFSEYLKLLNVKKLNMSYDSIDECYIKKT